VTELDIDNVHSVDTSTCGDLVDGVEAHSEGEALIVSMDRTHFLIFF
jgi:hypothetical protein